MEKLASAAQRLRAVRRAERRFLALWAMETLARENPCEARIRPSRPACGRRRN